MSLAVTASPTSSPCLTAMSAADQSAPRKSRWVCLSACMACLLGCCIDALRQKDLGWGGLVLLLAWLVFWAVVQMHRCPTVCIACHLGYCMEALLQKVQLGCPFACVSPVMGQHVLGDCVDPLTQKVLLLAAISKSRQGLGLPAWHKLHLLWCCPEVQAWLIQCAHQAHL